MNKPVKLHPASLAAQALGWIDETTRAVTPPIHLSTTFERNADGSYPSGFVYTRSENPGDHVLAPKVMYWSLRNWLLNFATHWGLQVELIDLADPAALRAALRPGQTKLVWAETPANPLWTITDIALAAQLAHAAGARLVVDSTWRAWPPAAGPPAPGWWWIRRWPRRC